MIDCRLYHVVVFDLQKKYYVYLFVIRMSNQMKAQNYFYRLIDAFWLFVILWMINDENEHDNVELDENDFSKFRYKFEISIWYNNSRYISIVTQQIN